MSRVQGNKLYNNFSRGLITEASALAFPENATIDELNCDIQENGVRVRRYGFSNIPPSSWSDQILNTYQPGEIYEDYVWAAVSKNSNLNFLVIQVESTLHFWSIEGRSSGTKKSFTLSLTTYLEGTGTAQDLKTSPCQFASGKGELFVAHKNLAPLRIIYDEDTDTISASKVTIKIRDFVGLDDGLPVDAEPTTLSTEHHYNLMNQGWVTPSPTNSGTQITSYSMFGEEFVYSNNLTSGPIQAYEQHSNRYPGNNKIWWSSKDNNGHFDPGGLEDMFFGNTRAPRGHFILEAFNKNRGAVSGLYSIPTEADTDRPTCVEFFSGRVFWAHKSDIYFSPVLEDGSRAGQCFQEADPTAENISDLIATDGGHIPLPHAQDIVALKEIGNGIVVFTVTGVWYLAASTQGFSALEYSLSKINEIGTTSFRTIVKAESQIFWWSETGIHALSQSMGQFGEISGKFDQSNITESTIQTFYNKIDENARLFAKGAYDPASQKIVWIYQDNGGTNGVYENLLWLDLKLQAFIPWKVPALSIAGNGSTAQFSITSVFKSPYFAEGTEDETFLEFPSYIDYFDSLSNNGSFITLGNFTDKTYVDWPDNKQLTLLVTGRGYESYIITGYESLGDGLRIKQAPIVGAFFKRSESSVTESPTGEYTVDNPSSCFFQARWDWANTDNGNWSRQVQAYRPKSHIFVDPANPTANAEFDVVYSRNKVRGSGRAVQFKFSESQFGHGFELLGWHVFYNAKSVP